MTFLLAIGWFLVLPAFATGLVIGLRDRSDINRLRRTAGDIVRENGSGRNLTPKE